MLWHVSNRFSKRAVLLADRHYNRQRVGSPQFVAPGRCLVLLTANIDALWVTRWPVYTQHRWPGAWECTLFRNESPHKASELIRQAVAAALAKWPEIPDLGMVTFIDREQVRPTMVRGKQVWGWTYLKAGFEPDGETQGGLLALRLRPENMPAPEPAIGMPTCSLFATT